MKHVPDCHKRWLNKAGLVLFILQAMLFSGHANVDAADFSGYNTKILLLESELENRPIFAPSRKAPAKPKPLPVLKRSAPPPVVEEVVSAIDDWVLIGVLKSSGKNLAILRNEKNSEVHRIQTGEMRDGWELLSIEGKRARFSNGSETAELIFESEKPSSDQ